jgi:hypothetical protein
VRNCGAEPAGGLSSGRGEAPFLDALVPGEQGL